jgi:hypothetical protein
MRGSAQGDLGSGAVTSARSLRRPDGLTDRVRKSCTPHSSVGHTTGPNIVTARGGFCRSHLNSKEKTTKSGDEEVTASCRARYTQLAALQDGVTSGSASHFRRLR